jgi:hypothetical protein
MPRLRCWPCARGLRSGSARRRGRSRRSRRPGPARHAGPRIGQRVTADAPRNGHQRSRERGVEPHAQHQRHHQDAQHRHGDVAPGTVQEALDPRPGGRHDMQLADPLGAGSMAQRQAVLLGGCDEAGPPGPIVGGQLLVAACGQGLAEIVAQGGLAHRREGQGALDDHGRRLGVEVVAGLCRGLTQHGEHLFDVASLRGFGFREIAADLQRTQHGGQRQPDQCHDECLADRQASCDGRCHPGWPGLHGRCPLAARRCHCCSASSSRRAASPLRCAAASRASTAASSPAHGLRRAKP